MKHRSKQRFDYSREPHSNFDKTYYGLHMKNHHLHIDTKRLRNFVPKIMIPELFDTPRNTHYFIPKKVHIKDYKINQLMNTLNWLEYEWNHTYKGYCESLKNPRKVYEEHRLNSMCFTSCADDIDDIETESFMEAVKSIPLYENRVLDLYYVFIEKIQQEYLNIWTYISDENGYSDDDFSFRSFIFYYNTVIGTKNNITDKNKSHFIENCPHFKYFDFLNRIVNFVKHKTIRSYQTLIFESGPRDRKCKYRDEFIKLVKKVNYKNGRDAIGLLKLPDNYLMDTIDNLKEFSKEVCKLAFDEDCEEARWNSEEFLYKQIMDLIREDY